ncbi:MAG: glutathione S-transferase family protein [Rhizobiales bacterium]|nr:glutathione S-transferase family protein [Hyphomicrobiales bacterium]
MLKIYSIPPSLYSAKLRILLRHKGLEWNEVLPPGGYGSDEYKQIVPTGNIPALVDGNLLLADSEAIAEYLNEKYPDPPMLPSDLAQRAEARQLSRFHDTRLEPELRKLFAHVSPDTQDQVLNETQCAAINAKLVQIAAVLPARMNAIGSMLTLGDCGFPISQVWIDALAGALGMDIHWPNAFKDYLGALHEHVAVKTELSEYRPKIAGWVASKAAA